MRWNFTFHGKLDEFTKKFNQEIEKAEKSFEDNENQEEGKATVKYLKGLLEYIKKEATNYKNPNISILTEGEAGKDSVSVRNLSLSFYRLKGEVMDEKRNASKEKEKK